MNDFAAQGSVHWQSLRAWQGSRRSAYRAWCLEWIRMEVVPNGARMVESLNENREIDAYFVLQHDAEWHWLICDDVEYFGLTESRALTSRVLQYVEHHPRVVRLTIALPYPFAVRVHAASGDEPSEWKSLLSRCAHLIRAQGRSVALADWNPTKWQEQWERMNQRGLLPFWFTSATLSPAWLEKHTCQAIASLPKTKTKTDDKNGRALNQLWIDAWFRDPSYYQKVSQLRRKFHGVEHLILAIPFPDHAAFQRDLKVVMAALWLQPLYPRDSWDNQRVMGALGQLRGQVQQVLERYERLTSPEEKTVKKSLLQWMRLLMEVQQFVEQLHWWVYHMPYVITSASSKEEATGFEEMIRRGTNGKYLFLLLLEDDPAFHSVDQWLALELGISCPAEVVWETLQNLGDRLHKPVFLVVVSKVQRSQSEWQSWASALTAQWVKYSRLSCWVHQLNHFDN